MQARAQETPLGLLKRMTDAVQMLVAGQLLMEAAQLLTEAVQVLSRAARL